MSPNLPNDLILLTSVKKVKSNQSIWIHDGGFWKLAYVTDVSGDVITCTIAGGVAKIIFKHGLIAKQK